MIELMRENKILLIIIILLCSLMDNCRPNPKSHKVDNNFIKKYFEKGLNESQFSGGVIELERQFSFPDVDLEDKGIFFMSPSKLACDESGNIYVVDSRANRVYKFNSSGHFLNQIGQQGNGPGEFSIPNDLLIHRDKLIISDLGNYRIQFLDFEGKYIKSFNKYLTFYSMAINDDSLLVAAPLVYENKSSQINVLTQEGKIIHSFGQPMHFRKDPIRLNFVEIDINMKGELLVAFRYLALVRKYSKKGELLDEYKLNNEAMKKFENMNLARNSIGTKESKEAYIMIINSIKAYEDGFFILSNSKCPIILGYDDQGHQNAVYWIQDCNYIAKDFLVQNKERKKIFYLLQVYPNLKIDAFGQKQ